MKTALIVPLEKAADVQLVGGKALALGRLIRAGFPIPPGFVITPQAPGALDQPQRVQIMDAFQKLAASHVAVRSSSLHEDSLAATWAGQFATFLGVDQEQLMRRIEECQASTNSAQAEAYGSQQGLKGGAMAVIVQAMVDSEVSGVAFSVHPVTKDSRQLMIEAGLGLGEAIVSGEITPDNYVVQKETGAVIGRNIASQTKQLVRDKAGSTAWKTIEPSAASQKLNDEQMYELAALISRIEVFFGHPVDVEWAWANGRFYILQSRPLTSL